MKVWMLKEGMQEKIQRVMLMVLLLSHLAVALHRMMLAILSQKLGMIYFQGPDRDGVLLTSHCQPWLSTE